jgi:hypothetical protein
MNENVWLVGQAALRDESLPLQLKRDWSAQLD